MENEVKVNVKNCSRCGQDHDDLVFERITHPMDSSEASFGWYAACPTVHRTIYMKFTED